MKKEQISNMGIEELKKKVATRKLTTGVLIGLVLVMFAAAFIPGENEPSWVTKLLPISFLPLVVVNIITTRRLIVELNSRKE